MSSTSDTNTTQDGTASGTIRSKTTYTRHELLALGDNSCRARPQHLIDFNADGSWMACSLLSKGAYNWEQMSSALKDASSGHRSRSKKDSNPTGNGNNSKSSYRPSSPTRWARTAAVPQQPSQAAFALHQPEASLYGASRNTHPAGALCTPPTNTSQARPYQITSFPSAEASNQRIKAAPAGTGAAAARLSNDAVGTSDSSDRGPRSPAARPEAASPAWCMADDDLIAELVGLLAHPDPSVAAQAAGQLAVLAFSSSDDQETIVRAAGIPALIKLLHVQCSAEVQENAAAALWGLGTNNTMHQAIILDSGAIPRLVRLLGSTATALQHTAASALRVLAQGNPRRQQAFADAGAIQMLMHVIKAGCSKAKQVAADVLQALIISNPVNQQELAKTGVIPVLVALLGPPSSNSSKDTYCAAAAMNGAVDPGVQNAALGVLLVLITGNHSLCWKHLQEVLAAGAVPRLQHLLCNGSSSVRGNAVLALQKLVPPAQVHHGRNFHAA